jgi:small subunit ribosomal protein S7
MSGKILLFNKWDFSEVVVSDAGLKKYINLSPVIIPKTFGRFSTDSIHKSKINIIERFINKLAVAGHKGKKHKLTSGHMPGNYQRIMKNVKKAFEIIEKRTKKNPIQVLVQAIENAALYEEVASYRVGGIIARKAVVTSPQRRLDVALRLIAQDIYSTSFKSKKKLYEVIAEELIMIAENDQRNNVIKERARIEKEAEGAR